MKKKFTDLFLILLFVFLTVLMIAYPSVCRRGALDGLMLCGRAVIPALFPFSFCILMIMRLGFCKYLKFLNRISAPVLRLNYVLFSVFLLSLTGGYPIGAQLLRELRLKGRTDVKTAQTVLCFCVNAGPAFVVTAIGESVWGSAKAGCYLLFSHIAAAFILAFISRFSVKYSEAEDTQEENAASVSEIFVSSAADSAAAMLNICGTVVLFSVINSYVEQYPRLRFITMLSEITNAAAVTENIYITAFLLGFGGISVWLQIISIVKADGINILRFILFRILHGLISVLIIYTAMRFFPLSLDTLSNNVNFTGNASYSGAAVSVSLLIMVLLFIISIFSKINSGKFLKDMI